MNKKAKVAITIIVAVIAVVSATIVGWGCINRTSAEERIRDSVAEAWSKSSKPDDPAYLQEIAKLSSYEIISIDEDDVYTINVVVTGIDMGSELERINREDFPRTEDDINAYLIGIIDQCPQTKTKTVIYAVPTDDAFQISFTDTFVDAMNGKIYSYYMDKLEEIIGGA